MALDRSFHPEEYHPWLPIYYFGGQLAPIFDDVPTGRDPIAVNQPGAYGDDYPWVDPRADVDLLLGDFYLSYEDDDRNFKPPFKVVWLYGFGNLVTSPPAYAPSPTHNVDVLVYDDNNAEVFDSTTASVYTERLWDNRLRTAQWVGDDGVLRLTWHVAWPAWMTPIDYAANIVPSNGELDPRTYQRMPLRVKSLIVGAQKITGSSIDLESGFNIGMETEQQDAVDGGRRTTRLEIRAVPGAGLGRQPGCLDPDIVVRRFNGVGADDSGNFTLDLGECYRTQRPLQVTSENPRQLDFGNSSFAASLAATIGGIQSKFIDTDPTIAAAVKAMYTDDADVTAQSALHAFNDCFPCYECDDFVKVYRALTSVWNKYLILGQRAEVVRNQFQLNIDRWEAQKACRESNNARVVMRTDERCQIAFSAIWANITTCCLAPLQIRFTLRLFLNGLEVSADNVVILCGETTVSGSILTGGEEEAAFAGDGSVWDMFFDSADPGVSTRIKTKMLLPDCQDGHVLQVAMTAHVPDSTEAGCELPTVIPPSWVTDIWGVDNVPEHPTRSVIIKMAPFER